MKKITLLFLLFGITSFAQTQYKIGEVFIMKEQKELKDKSNKPLMADKDDVLEIIGIDCNDYTVKNHSNDSIYKMSSTELLLNGESKTKRFKGAQVGIYTIPFRLRGGGDSFDFETSLSLQTNLILGFGRWDKEKSWFDASIGLGISSINLNSSNSNVIEDRTASALTASFGAVVKPVENVNFGLFIGGDFLNKNDRKTDWVHNGNLWIGLGINISFNKIDDGDPVEVSKLVKENEKKKAKIKKAKSNSK